MIYEQINLFDRALSEFKIDKPIRLIELFAGYGSQHLALKYLNADVESYKICEWAVKSIQAYKDLHFGEDNTDYSDELSKDDVIDYLYEKGISADYNKPMTREQIKRMGEAKCRIVYNNIKATHNLVSVTTAKGDDFEITDRDKFTYLLTYSFPCQDLSLAGKQKGMSKDSETRSGLLWQVERLLNEFGNNLPQVLLMENVPQVHGKKNIEDFNTWIKFLESKGYTNYWQDLNAKHYGVPQNRNRCFMVSILGDYKYDFPKPIPLEKKLKDVLEDSVDEKYYLSNTLINAFIRNEQNQRAKGNSFKFDVIDDTNKAIAKTIKTKAGSRMDDNFIKEPNRLFNIYGENMGGGYAGNVYDTNSISPTLTTMQGGNRQPLIEEPVAYDEQNRYIRQDGCVGTLTTDGSSPKHNNRVIEPQERFFRQAIETVQENNVNDFDTIDAYNKKVNSTGISPTITTRPDGFKTAILPYQNYRIRKLTPKECFRLMGVNDNDFEKIAQNQSNSSLYHLAGDSIVTNCLIEIFRMMLRSD